MSKRRNTLKDLDEFLKQQAASLVSPEKLSSKKEEAAPSPATQFNNVQEEAEITLQRIVEDLQKLASRNKESFRKQFYDIIINTLGSRNHITPEDKVLINTALYLRHGDRWKEMIRRYWKERNSKI